MEFRSEATPLAKDQYYRCKEMMEKVAGKSHLLSKAMKKHYMGYRDYIQEFESGGIGSLWDFFMQSNVHAEKWRRLPFEKWKTKLEGIREDYKKP